MSWHSTRELSGSRVDVLDLVDVAWSARNVHAEDLLLKDDGKIPTLNAIDS